ncbi:MAG: HAMP domain-containing histidine kinase [Ruminococcaceae bacterium]|nr:HAMP domain-containing histidine kinase [Oscillospiraceae bacterium]
MRSKKSNIITFLVLLTVLAVSAYFYNASVRATISDAAGQAKGILYEYNNEIISKLIAEESTENWNNIVNDYDEIIVTVEDNQNNEIAKSKENTWTALDVKVQTPFEFGGKAYLIISSVYLLEDYVADVKAIAKFIFMELLLVVSALVLMAFAVYTLVLRPFTKLYRAIEEYDKTGELEKTHIKGYAGKVYRRFVSMTENLEANQRNQKRIIASISHDIKTPLTSIMGYAERLQKEGISEERKSRYLSTVYEKSIEIKELVNEFDEYLSLNQKQQVKWSFVSAEDIAAAVKTDYGADLEDAGIILSVNNYADDAQVEIDKLKFKRVFGNIFANSVKHFKGNIKFIRVDIYADKSNVYFHINDSGEGVPEEKLELIFEPLYTSDEGRKVAGLGLSICREIIDAHSGRIFAQKSDLGGLEVVIELDRKNKGDKNGNQKK